VKIKTAPHDVWQEYLTGRSYKDHIELYDNVRTNENFYNGNQWEGLNAPDLPKPTLNFLKRVVNFINASIMSDDIAVNFAPHSTDDDIMAKALSRQMDKVIENTKLKSKLRDALRDAPVDGDACIYGRFDPDIETGQPIKGDIVLELIENINTYFGNPYTPEVEKQPYIIIAQRKTVEQIKDEAKQNGVKQDDIDQITSDTDDKQGEEGTDYSLATKLIKLWREDGTIHCLECTEKVTIREAWDTTYTLYPLAWMNWDRVKSCYHGQAALTGLIQNQIQVNRLFAMTIRSVEMNAFPKIVYDPNKIKQWTNKAGEAIKAVAGAGNVQDAFSAIRGADVSDQVMQVIDKTISMTRDFMGASDAALGNVKPENTSAIIAVQQASAIPLELNKHAFYQFVEDIVRFIVDLMRAHYGKRMVAFDEGVEDANGNPITEMEIDFGMFDTANYDLNVDIGAASYWSELTQMQTMDNLFAKGLITDAVTYLESVPSKYLRGKEKLIESMKKQQEAAEAQAEAMAQAQMAGAAAGQQQARQENDPNAVAQQAANDPNIQNLLSQIGG
jgi:hypothetical protein